MKSSFAFESLIESLRGAIQNFPDKRNGSNLRYTMEDVASDEIVTDYCTHHARFFKIRL